MEWDSNTSPPSHLRFWNCPNLNKLSHLQHLTSIKRLSFWLCPNLYTFPHDQHLTSLQHLEFWNCRNMMDLPEVLLPSLLSLRILGDCPVLKERCSKKGDYWPFISNIPNLDLPRWEN
ncbi:hypothetical protein SSX86_012233 [Deinandra increscens subsp. villosa]|uniref:Uncharacterized protein n=1 Tax=Deinandra increscens subsp. villosa TaxID=3103831 RepID=A0AAP0D8B9_9ASTR